MKITGVELSSDNGSVFSFALNKAATTDKYYAKTIIGLDTDELVSKFYARGGASNQRFYNFSMPKREIVIRVLLNPDYSINESFSDIRDEMYRSISSSRSGLINMLFTAGGAVVATLSGFITKFEVPYFSKVPELQITIKSDIDPMLRGYSPVVLESADLSTTNPVIVGDTLSTAPHGFKFEITFTAITTSFTIQDVDPNPDWTFTVQPDTAFQIGDILTISSEFGNRSVVMDRSGGITYLLDKIVPGSVWPTIFPKVNEFHFPEIANFDWVYLSHYPAYWGI